MHTPSSGSFVSNIMSPCKSCSPYVLRLLKIFFLHLVWIQDWLGAKYPLFSCFCILALSYETTEQKNTTSIFCSGTFSGSFWTSTVDEVETACARYNTWCRRRILRSLWRDCSWSIRICVCVRRSFLSCRTRCKMATNYTALRARFHFLFRLRQFLFSLLVSKY